jgi:hypothetical protein
MAYACRRASPRAAVRLLPTAQRRALATARLVTAMRRLAVTWDVNRPPRVTVTAAREPITVWLTFSGIVALPVAVTTARAVSRAWAWVVTQAR